MTGSSLTDLIDSYCAAWNEPDAARRTAMLAAVWTPDATYADPAVDNATAEDLVAHIERIRQSRPGASVKRCGPIDHHHTYARFSFHVIMPDGSVIREGIDIVDLSADGRKIRRIVGFFDG